MESHDRPLGPEDLLHRIAERLADRFVGVFAREPLQAAEPSLH